MESVSQNGILKDEDFAKFKERTVGLRFRQQISYGLGAAMVFGLFTAVATQLVPMAIGGVGVAASIPAMIGLAGIAVIGMGLIYLSAKFLSENTLLEQDFQAKKIGAAARGVSPTMAPSVDQKPIPFPATASLDAAPAIGAEQPSTKVTDGILHDRVVSLDAAKKAIAAAQQQQSFVERATAHDASTEQKVRG
jgi:hypothetical protein